MNRFHYAACSINPPKFERGDLCFVFGDNFFAVTRSEKLQTYNNHGRVVGFSAIFNEYAIVLLGLDANKPIVTKFKASEINPRLQRDANEWRSLDAVLMRSEHFPKRD